MSIQAFIWAEKVKLYGLSKLILLGLGIKADQYGRCCSINLREFSQDYGMNIFTVLHTICELAKQKIIIVDFANQLVYLRMNIPPQTFHKLGDKHVH